MEFYEKPSCNGVGVPFVILCKVVIGAPHVIDLLTPFGCGILKMSSAEKEEAESVQELEIHTYQKWNV